MCKWASCCFILHSPSLELNDTQLGWMCVPFRTTKRDACLLGMNSQVMESCKSVCLMVLHCWPHCIISFFIWFQVIAAAAASQGNERSLVHICWSISGSSDETWSPESPCSLSSSSEWRNKMGNGLSEPHAFFPCLPSFQALHIVILGLDCAGKTTVLYRLRFNEFVNTVPTKGFNTEKIKVTLGGKRRTAAFHFWDVGGQEKLRPLWRSYTRCADGLVFVVDSVDAERMEEAKTELHKITRLQENQGVPVLVVANKQDLRNALPLGEVEQMLALNELGSHTPWHLQPACAIIGEGLQEGLERLNSMIIKRRKMIRQQKRKRWLFGELDVVLGLYDGSADDGRSWPCTPGIIVLMGWVLSVRWFWINTVQRPQEENIGLPIYHFGCWIVTAVGRSHGTFTSIQVLQNVNRSCGTLSSHEGQHWTWTCKWQRPIPKVFVLASEVLHVS